MGLKSLQFPIFVTVLLFSAMGLTNFDVSSFFEDC